MAPPDQNAKLRTARSLRLPGIIFIVLVIGIVIYGVVSRSTQASQLGKLTEAEAVPNVAVVAPGRAENSSGFELPGRLEAFIQAPIYAPRSRISEELEARHWQQGQSRRFAR